MRVVVIDTHQWTIEMVEPGGRTLGLRPIDPDWEPVEELLRFVALREERLPSSTTPPEAAVAPVWHPRQGAPYVAGFEGRLGADLPGAVSARIGFDYFGDAATRLSSEFVKRGELKNGDTFTYLVRAVPAENGANAGAGADRTAPLMRASAVVPGAIDVHDGDVVDRFAGATVLGEPTAGDLPVVVPRAVLDEMSAIARAAGPREVGGILLGKLYRDPASREMFAEVVTQLPALEAKGELTHLEFTPETWAAVAQLMRLRDTDEMALGWWHFHPAHLWQCRNCPVERRRECPVGSGFFSDEDRLLHRTVFPRAYTVALVVSSISDDEHRVKSFGWRDSRIQARAIHVSEDRHECAQSRHHVAPTDVQGEASHGS